MNSQSQREAEVREMLDFANQSYDPQAEPGRWADCLVSQVEDALAVRERRIARLEAEVDELGEKAARYDDLCR